MVQKIKNLHKIVMINNNNYKDKFQNKVQLANYLIL